MARSDAEVNKQKILKAFRELIQAGELSDVPTMSDVVRQSGLGRGTVYRHFPDIGSLAFSILDSEYSNLFENSRKQLADATGREELLNTLQDHLKRSSKLTLMNRKLLLADDCVVSAGYKKAKQSMRSLISDILTRLTGRKHATQQLLIYSDLIARCVEAGHLEDTGKISKLDQSVDIAMDIAHRIIE